MLTTRAELSRLLLQRQGLMGERLLGGMGGALAWVSGHGFLPLELRPHALAPGHDIALFERISGYRAGGLEMALYDRERVFEHCLHIPGALPASDYPLIYDPQREAVASRPGSIGAMVLDLLAEAGPATLREMQAQLRDHRRTDRRAFGRAVHDLHACGAILILRREAGQELYDLAERVLPGCRRHPLPLEERLPALAARALRILAPVTRGNWSQVLNAMGSRARLGLTAMKRAKGRIMDEMLAAAQVVEARVEDPPGTYMLPADWLPRLNGQARAPRVAFLSPLDPVVWDRQRARDLFGFDWRQAPARAADRRQFSAPSLAILYGDRVVGCIEPQVSWSQRRLVLRTIHLADESLAEDAQYRAAFAAAVNDLATFHEVGDVQAGSPLLQRLLD